jgi:histidinol-phosphate/aromatic aminotransferase/cobyric acid decarboxylase-like protein
MIERQNNFEIPYFPALRLHKAEFKFSFDVEAFKRKLTSEDFTLYPNMKRGYDTLEKNLDLNYEKCILGEGSDRIIKYGFEVLRDEIKNVDYPFSLICLSNPHSPYGEELDINLYGSMLSDYQSYMIDDRAYYSILKKEDLEFNDRILISYTFSKYFGAAGIRLGLGVSGSSLMKRIKQWRTMFECSNVAIKYLEFYFENQNYYNTMYDRLHETKLDFYQRNKDRINFFYAGNLPWFFVDKKPLTYYNDGPVLTTYNSQLEMYKIDIPDTLEKLEYIL